MLTTLGVVCLDYTYQQPTCSVTEASCLRYASCHLLASAGREKLRFALPLFLLSPLSLSHIVVFPLCYYVTSEDLKETPESLFSTDKTHHCYLGL